MTSYKVTVDISGPIFDGMAEHAADAVVEDAVKVLAGKGTDRIKAEALTMNKSGRAGTGPGGPGAASRNVLLFDHGKRQVIYGAMIETVTWWPWLEGISKRNDSTSFKGYWTFKRTAAYLDTIAKAELEKALAEHIGEMGG